jgi:hypothetical protein
VHCPIPGFQNADDLHAIGLSGSPGIARRLVIASPIAGSSSGLIPLAPFSPEQHLLPYVPQHPTGEDLQGLIRDGWTFKVKPDAGDSTLVDCSARTISMSLLALRSENVPHEIASAIGLKNGHCGQTPATSRDQYLTDRLRGDLVMLAYRFEAELGGRIEGKLTVPSIDLGPGYPALRKVYLDAMRRTGGDREAAMKDLASALPTHASSLARSHAAAWDKVQQGSQRTSGAPAPEATRSADMQHMHAVADKVATLAYKTVYGAVFNALQQSRQAQ